MKSLFLILSIISLCLSSAAQTEPVGNKAKTDNNEKQAVKKEKEKKEGPATPAEYVLSGTVKQDQDDM